MKRSRKWLGLGLAVASLAVATTTSWAGTNFWDLNNSSVTNELIIRGSGPDGGGWRQEADGNGFIQITGAVDGQSGAILFPDADDGLVVKAFTFEAKIKLGDGENPPADGFSLNYASSTDPVVTSLLAGNNASGWAGSQDNGGTENNLPEEGTTTGLAIGFDTWGAPGGGNGPADPATGQSRDLRGISIRVNGTQRAQIPMPNLLVNNPAGDPNDPTSLETGFPGGGTGTNLLWAPLRVTLDELGVVNVFWKGSQVLTNVQTDFFPIPGRIVFGGRTGGNHAIQWVDDISLSTIASETFLISGLIGNAEGFVVTVNDAQGSVLNPATINLTLNGTLLPSTEYTVAKSGNVSTITYSELPNFFPGGSTNLVGITAQDGAGNEATLERPFVVRPYIQLDPAWIAAPSEYNTADPGFIGSINQIAIGRFPGDANNIWNAYRHLAGGFIDPATGNAYANLVDPGAGEVDANGNFEVGGDPAFADPWINMNQDVIATTPSEAGRFRSTLAPQYADYQLPGIPGTTLSTDNIVAEYWGYVQVTGPKLHTFVVNSDDGFRVSFGPDKRSALFTAPGGASTSAIAGQFNGGKGSSDVTFDVVVPEGAAGVYQTRLVWWEGGGGANVEFFTLVSPGVGGAALIGDTAVGGLPVYKPAGAVQVPADVVSAAPWPGQTGVAPDSQVQIIIADGAGQVVDANSITVALNGEQPPKTATKVGNKTRVTVTPDGLLDPNTVYTVEINYTAGGTAKSASYQFTVINYPTLPPFLATPIGTGSEPGMRWRTHQIIVSHGTIISGAESTLAGNLGPSVHDPNGHTTPQGADGFFRIDWVNMTQVPGTENEGNFRGNQTNPLLAVPDEGIPGIPGTTASTDNIAAEALTFIELQPGFYRMVVNSDDGFEVTTGTADPANRKFLSLGRFDGGRGASDTVFFFNVEQAGVYFFRLLWFEGGGGANVEWFTVDANGVRSLIGGEQAGSLDAFRVRSVAEPTIPSEAEFNPPTISAGQVTLSWTGAGTLQESTNLTDWSNSASQANPQTVTPVGVVKAYRILVSP